MYPEIASFGPFTIGPFSVGENTFGPFTIGPIGLYTFGLMMGLGFLVAANLAGRELARRGRDPEIASSLLIATVVGGLVGSRVWAVYNEWDLFLEAPLTALFAGAGFVWYGGLIGGAISSTWVFWRHSIPWLQGADCVAPGLALGQALGRIGCHLGGDGDWGRLTDVPWGVAYTHAIIGWPHAEGELVHPTPLYECAAYTAVFALLWSWRARAGRDGEIFALYLLTAPAARFVIEFYRVNPPVLFGLTQAQLFSLALVACGALLLAWLRGTRDALGRPHGVPAGATTE